MSKDPYQGSDYKITKQQWDELNEFYQTIEPPAQNELYASGDHYLLFVMLSKMGFRPSSDALEIYRMAGQILAARQAGMNKETVLQLNVIPEGKAAWLSYDRYQELRRLFEAVELPAKKTGVQDQAYLKLYEFLTEVAQLSVPKNEFTIHFNALALIRRGYAIEEITTEEYEQLSKLMIDADEADIEDMALYDFGGHRELYNFLTRKMGLSVRPGRGPVWHRAKDLLNHYERLHAQNGLS